jgi:SPOR domain
MWCSEIGRERQKRRESDSSPRTQEILYTTRLVRDRAKFPNHLGGRQPIVSRTDLGTEGIYYRALVGPFASMQEAAGLCSTLKAAGDNCLIERN